MVPQGTLGVRFMKMKLGLKLAGRCRLALSFVLRRAALRRPRWAFATRRKSAMRPAAHSRNIRIAMSPVERNVACIAGGTRKNARNETSQECFTKKHKRTTAP